MATIDSCPEVSDIERYKNLTLSGWAPPSEQTLAADWMLMVLRSVIFASDDIFLLGHSSGAIQKVTRDTLEPKMVSFLEGLIPTSDEAPLLRIPQELAKNSLELLRPGDINVRETQIDKSTNRSRVLSAHLGRPLVRLSLAQARGIIEPSFIASPFSFSLSCVTNPQSGLRQPDARWLKAIDEWTGHDIALVWRQTSLSFLGGLQALLEMRTFLLEWLEREGRDELR